MTHPPTSRSDDELRPEIAQTAADLRRAYAGQPVAPLRHVVEPDDAETAYQIQAFNTRHWLKGGRKQVGHKIGLTSKSVQQQLGVDQPDFGVLFDDMEIASGARVDASALIQPKAEAEIAVVLKSDIVSTDPSHEQLVQAIDYAVAAIEIVDSRITDWKITFADTVADNGSSALFVLGEERKRPEDIDMTGCAMRMTVDGDVASSGTGAACLGHPLNALGWLAATLSQQGEHLRAGDIILTGALGPMITLQESAHIEAAIDGLGSVSFNYDKPSGGLS
ncbi:2-keto-4-pentenoate hydratase [Erythrobacter sp. KY5]|uniref:2-keto-4-pentenoate hydratase n=1 Tax=Erythrobacter sp. KY5 TaxID=2011159 RepID=UPI000DBF0972|nr:fumarylacetoacetate hydrolase family protein [Erythrobacter sp. KY5]AWW74408.1 2-keto-4-pentenoate hydratase [Erythrobacter sp. KY5]